MEKIIEQSMKDLADIIVGKPNKHKIVFPSYQHGNKKGVRYSEQELKQVFLHNLESDSNYCYSVETPTKYFYNISNAKKNNQPPQVSNKVKPNYESGNIDVSVYDINSVTMLNVSHIEFKHGNSDGIDKDFLRLACEFDSDNNYFVHYTVKESIKWKSMSYPSLINGYIDAVKNLSVPQGIVINLLKVVVYLMFVDTNAKNSTILKFTLEDISNLTNLTQPVGKFDSQNLPKGFQML